MRCDFECDISRFYDIRASADNAKDYIKQDIKDYTFAFVRADTYVYVNLFLRK